MNSENIRIERFHRILSSLVFAKIFFIYAMFLLSGVWETFYPRAITEVCCSNVFSIYGKAASWFIVPLRHDQLLEDMGRIFSRILILLSLVFGALSVKYLTFDRRKDERAHIILAPATIALTLASFVRHSVDINAMLEVMPPEELYGLSKGRTANFLLTVFIMFSISLHFVLFYAYLETFRFVPLFNIRSSRRYSRIYLLSQDSALEVASKKQYMLRKNYLLFVFYAIALAFVTLLLSGLRLS